MIELTEDDREQMFAYSKDDPAVPEIREFWNFKTCVLCGRDVRVARILCDACRPAFNAIEPPALRRQLSRTLWQQVRMLGLFTTPDLPTILYDLIKMVHDLYGFDRVGAYLVDQRSNRIRGIGLIGLPKRYIENFDISIESDQEEDASGYGMIRHVARTGERIIVNDRSGDPQYRDLVARETAPDLAPAKCIAIFPLPTRSRKQVMGIMSVSNLPAHPTPEITLEQVGLLELLLSYASLTIQTAKDILDRQRALEEASGKGA
ncbi:MAG: hypothetical protein A3G34_15485 [Candidatus Lindowbacteria bacterium RIFCSPLOWO2_12_FULL_62_27]|nr:MAG: hypothetical protein A3I06_01980 [Candidatus Lindowbacteria bacterium RIFCSPLOWO2_02_FULL_62_12]OGH63253.1 MAG: hypothetical protein A3G34_15485 [Candidatus Lindowbacteria bacterium RIFCSPLOWO2_12_FULL_62_27]